MAFEKNRKVSIQWKLNPDAFAIMNKAVINDVTRKFGTSVNAVNSMLVKKELLDTTMPIILGINPTDQGWQKAVANYWNSIAVDIPENGKELEIGFSFDLSDKDRAKYISGLVSKYKLKTDEDLANAVMAEIPEDEKYRYGTPLKADDYLLWIFSTNYRDVANSINDINKSAYIRFYIHDDEVQKKQKEAYVDLAMKAQEKFIEVVKSNDSQDKIYNILCVLEPTEINNINALNAKERNVRLFDVYQKNPSDFMIACDDKNLHTKAFIEQLLAKNILRKMPNTDVITDVDDASIIIGNTTTDAVSWFSLETNTAKVSEYKIRLKAAK